MWDVLQDVLPVPQSIPAPSATVATSLQQHRSAKYAQQAALPVPAQQPTHVPPALTPTISQDPPASPAPPPAATARMGPLVPHASPPTTSPAPPASTASLTAQSAPMGPPAPTAPRVLPSRATSATHVPQIAQPAPPHLSAQLARPIMR